MAITVSDIEQKEFAYKGAGYDPYDVDQFLDQICDEMDAMKERIDTLEAALAKARQEAENAAAAVRPMQQEVVRAPEPAVTPVAQTSQTLESILLSAQKLADGAVQEAKHRAEEIVREAEKKAAGIIDDAREENATLTRDMQTLREAAQKFRGNFLSLLADQKELLESSSGLFEGEDAAK